MASPPHSDAGRRRSPSSCFACKRNSRRALNGCCKRPAEAHCRLWTHRASPAPNQPRGKLKGPKTPTGLSLNLQHESPLPPHN
jgi:hypothetical protein